jgi:hypothetical protein
MGSSSLALFRRRSSGGGGAGEVTLRDRRAMSTTRGNEVAEKMVDGLGMYRVSPKDSRRDIQLLWFRVAENEVAGDPAPYKIGSR